MWHKSSFDLRRMVRQRDRRIRGQLDIIAQFDADLGIEKRKHLDTSNWAEEQQDRADKAEAENEQLWKFYKMLYRYWMMPEGPSDKEIYHAIAKLDPNQPLEVNSE